MFRLFQFAAFLVLCILDCSSTECPFVMRKGELYTLSDQALNFQEATKECSSRNGKLVQISSQEDRRFFEEHLKRKYLPDTLDPINIIQNWETWKVEGWITNETSYLVYKFRSNDSNKDTSNITGFEDPGYGRLKKIYLFKKNLSEDFREKVHFCYTPGRDVLLQVCRPEQGWNLNFARYGGTAETRNTIKVHNFYGRIAVITTVLTLNKTNPYPFDDEQAPLYLPDISVFIGAQSNVNETDWVWINGSNLNNPKYPRSDESLCQQMTWPLTYDNGINLRPKDCGSGESYYVCKVEVAVKLEEVECNGTALRLSVQASNVSKAYLEVTMPNHQTLSFLPEELSIIGNLSQRTEYTLPIRIRFSECLVADSIETEVTGTTGYGVPDSVTSARVENNSDSTCIVFWNHNKPSTEKMQYQFTILSNSSETKHVAEGKTSADGSFYFDLSDVLRLKTSYKHNDSFEFEIQALSSCGQLSESVFVNGSCVIPLTDSTNLSLYEIIAIAAGATGLCLIVGVIICICKRRSNRHKKTILDTSELVVQTKTCEARDCDVASSSERTNIENYVNVPPAGNSQETSTIWDPSKKSIQFQSGVINMGERVQSVQTKTVGATRFKPLPDTDDGKEEYVMMKPNVELVYQNFQFCDNLQETTEDDNLNIYVNGPV